ncbi:uncharacterized protein LAJ45_06439 [Morchella importuna]|uniref:uncharacterized protein n=1 Tax=Morchella importuna TaxID=1174673 RepID=UPI001E8E511F|nr:uncharacterized protein LAJ45_06439 [Morchella importuna]KAH8149360.1 hypothetical protein LAJ45_06439 [Morchella importuna]
MYADAAVFPSARLKPARTRLMTVEIDQSSLLRAQTAPATMNGAVHVPMGTPSIVSSSSLSIASAGGAGTTSPTISLSTPIGNDSLINRKADPSQGLYQTCVALRERLLLVPDFERFLEPVPGADTREDPVSQLWRCFRMGSSLCVLFNAVRPVQFIDEEHCRPDLGAVSKMKAATYHFIQGIKKELEIGGDDSFMIHNLYTDDTNGFVKVTRTVSKILDVLAQKNLLLHKGPSDNRSSSERKPLDNRARVVQELVDTERKYVQDLETLQEYMKELEADEVLGKDQIHILFANLNGLVDFQRRFLIRVETQNDQPFEKQQWGMLFVEYCREPEERVQRSGDPIGGPAYQETFAIYQPYASNFKNAQDLAMEEKAKLERKAHPVYQQLNAFLIKPIQRVTKYPLLLRDLIKHTDPAEAEDQKLQLGLEAIEEINRKINEAIRKAENIESVKDLEGRVEDWKGHKLEHFGELLLHGQFSVIKGDQKGDVEREYYIYLFERILLCCKEVGTGKKQKQAMMARPKPGKKKSMLQLKGRIFMQNVTDVISLSRGGTWSYTLQIFWKGDPGVENFIIKHTNEERLDQWCKALEKQREAFARAGTPSSRGTRTSGGARSTAAVDFAWMLNVDTGDQGQTAELSEDDDDELEDPAEPQIQGFNLPRNTSSASIRSRSATNESVQQQAMQQQMQHQLHQHQLHQQTPSGALPGTYAARPNQQSPMLPASHDASYFSPVSETPMSTRISSSSNQFPFPRTSTPGYAEDNRRYTPPSGFTPPNMSRSTSREGAAIAASQAQFAHHHQVQQASSRLQRPSLPGMAPPPAGSLQQNRMRSASSPNIHHLPSQAQLARSPGAAIPPIPSVPSNYVAYSGGPAVINRSQNNSPTSPNLPMQGGPGRNSPAIQENGLKTNGINGIQPQVKLKVNYGDDKFIIIVPSTIAYNQLLDRIEHKVKMCGATGVEVPINPIRIRYQDEDGDFISMNSDDDVQMAFDVSGDPGKDGSAGITGVVTLYVSA